MKSFHLYKVGKDCSICRELSASQDSLIQPALKTYGIDSIAIAGTEHFCAIPSLGPLVVGHSLIVTRSHASSVILFATHNGYWRELESSLVELMSSLRKRLGCSDFVVFEQGSANEFSALCSTSHAHLHVVPVPTRSGHAIERALGKRCSKLWIGEILQMDFGAKDFIAATIGYGAQLKEQWFFSDGCELPSQFMRREVARVMGLDHWNWRENPTSDLLTSTVELYLDVGTNY